MQCGASVTVTHFFLKLINGKIMSKNEITDKQLKSLEEILDYMWRDEMKHWFEDDMPEIHVFQSLRKIGTLVPDFWGHDYLKEWIEKNKEEANLLIEPFRKK
jgi:hypothetical protein